MRDSRYVRIVGGKLLWIDFGNACGYAECRCVLFHRKQRIHSEVVDGVRLWHVVSVPMVEVAA